MAVYTKVDSIELGRMLERYDLGVLKSHEGIEAGVSNTNYILTTTKGRYILTLFEPHRVEREDIPFYLEYAAALVKAGIPCPKAMPTKKGESVVELAGRPTVIFEFMDGKGTDTHHMTPDMCKQAGAVLAKMHLAVKKIEAKKPNRFGLSRWWSWIDHMGEKMDKISPRLHDIAFAEMAYLQRVWPHALPGGTVHGDFFPDNVFWKNGKISGVIDFHFVCTEYFAYELAIAVNAWCFDPRNKLDEKLYCAFLKGYESVRKLTPDENRVFPTLLRGAALRFLLSRAEEKLKWKTGDFMIPHDPLVFLQRLRHFQEHDGPGC